MTLADANPLSGVMEEHAITPNHLLVFCNGDTPTRTTSVLSKLHCKVSVAQTLPEFNRVLAEHDVTRVLIINYGMSGPGLEAIRRAVELGLSVTAMGPPEDLVFIDEALDNGAKRYLSAPVSGHMLCQELGINEVETARKVSVKTWPRTHNAYVDACAESYCGMLFSSSNVMQEVVSQVRRVAPTNATVFITGESGTGKEVIAEAIHAQSGRSDKPFLPINCGAMSPQLIESELFGHERGSFTGAVREHRGVFERADGGTLFLDEVTEMPLELQVKLLRVLETRRFYKVGSDREQQTDVRIVAATNRCVETEVENKKLRPDLLYRLQVFPIFLPPLRQRDGDVRILAKHFLEALNREEQASKEFSPEALTLLEHYTWPGNLRELKNAVQRGFIMSDGVITPDNLPCEIVSPDLAARHNGPNLTVRVGSSVADVEKDLIFATLSECGGKKEKAANILGVSMKTLYNRLREYEARSDSAETSSSYTSHKPW